MSTQEIISDLRSRGEYSIKFMDDGTIISCHGKHTVNYWIIKNGELYCYNSRTIY